MENKDPRGEPSPYHFNPFTGQLEYIPPERIKSFEEATRKVKTKGLTNEELEALAKRLNAPAVIVIGFASEIQKTGVHMGEFSFNSVGIGESVTPSVLEFVGRVMRSGYGEKKVEIKVLGGENIPPEVRQKVIEELKGRIERGEISFDKHGMFGVDPARSDMADATAYAMKARKDAKPLKISRHPQRTPLWKRVLTFFKRPKLTEDNLEPVMPVMTFSNLKQPTPEEVRDAMEMLAKGTKSQYVDEKLCLVCKHNIPKKDFEEHAIRHELEKNICPVCKVEQKGGVIAHIRAKAMWERRKEMTERPYSDRKSVV